MSDVAWRRSLYFVRARTFLYRHHRRRNRTRPVLPSSNRLVVKTFLVKLLFSLDLEAGKQPNPRRRVRRARMIIHSRSARRPRRAGHLPTAQRAESSPWKRGEKRWGSQPGFTPARAKYQLAGKLAMKPRTMPICIMNQ